MRFFAESKFWGLWNCEIDSFRHPRYGHIWYHVKYDKQKSTLILREITFWDSRNAKSANLTHLRALNLCWCEFFSLLEGWNYQINTVLSRKIGKNDHFRTFTISKIYFTWNLNDRNILKSPHCVLNQFMITLSKLYCFY